VNSSQWVKAAQSASAAQSRCGDMQAPQPADTPGGKQSWPSLQSASARQVSTLGSGGVVPSHTGSEAAEPRQPSVTTIIMAAMQTTPAVPKFAIRVMPRSRSK